MLFISLFIFVSDCIGSAFNIKGAMQCPNCRKIEKGQWLYANGSRSYPEFNMDDWTRDEDVYDLSYSEMVIIETACIFIPASVFVTIQYKHGFALSLCYDDKQTVIENECLFCFMIFHFPFICFYKVIVDMEKLFLTKRGDTLEIYPIIILTFTQ
jgi:hypothetical protein